jgi:hypothetical protein
MSKIGHSRPNWAVRAMFGFPPIATELRTSLVVRFVPNPDMHHDAEPLLPAVRRLGNFCQSSLNPIDLMTGQS